MYNRNIKLSLVSLWWKNKDTSVITAKSIYYGLGYGHLLKLKHSLYNNNKLEVL